MQVTRSAIAYACVIASDPVLCTFVKAVMVKGPASLHVE